MQREIVLLDNNLWVLNGLHHCFLVCKFLPYMSILYLENLHSDNCKYFGLNLHQNICKMSLFLYLLDLRDQHISYNYLRQQLNQ